MNIILTSMYLLDSMMTVAILVVDFNANCQNIGITAEFVDLLFDVFMCLYLYFCAVILE